MRKFLIRNLELKIVGSMFFTGEVIVYTFIAPFIGQNNLPVSLIWQMFVIAIILTLLQEGIYFSRVLENVKAYIKIIIHYISLLVLGIVSANVFNWFDITNIKNIIILISILTICFVAFSTSVALYYKITGEELNEKLRLYKVSKIKKGE